MPARIEAWDWERLDPLARLFSTLAAVGLQAGSLQMEYLLKLEMAHANLVGVRLPQCDLEAADLRKVVLRSARLEGAVLWRANLSWVSAEHADFTAVMMDLADLTEAELSDATFVDAHLKGAILMRAAMKRANLEHCELTAALG